MKRCLLLGLGDDVMKRTGVSFTPVSEPECSGSRNRIGMPAHWQALVAATKGSYAP